MAVGVAAQTGEGGLWIDQGFAFESSADKIDDMVGEVRDVAEGFRASSKPYNYRYRKELTPIYPSGTSA